MMSRLRVPGLLVLAACLAFAGWLLMSTNFMIHDDEGYVLIGLKNFSAHGRLYDEVFTQYGPVPFLYYEGWHRLFDWPVTNLFGRTLTLVHWIVAAFAAGLIAWRLSQRYWTALFTLVAVFGYLWQMTWEPPHPGGLIALIIAVGLAGAVEALARGRTAVATLILGLAGAALILTKINVGLFWICSAGAFLLIGTARRGAWLAAAGLMALPFVLMRPLLGESWVFDFAVVFALSGAAVCALVAAGHPPAVQFRDWLAGAAGFAGLGAATIIAILARGTSPRGLVNGVLLDPLRHPVNFHFGFLWPPLAWVVVVLAVALTALWLMRPALRPRLAGGIALLRLLALGCFAWQADTWLTIHGPGRMISLVLPLTPLFLLPLDEAPAGDRRRQATALVALIGVGQVLHAYPVAGTQLAWGSFLLLPLFVSGLAEAAGHLARRLQRSWLEPAVAAVALLAAAWQVNLLSDQGWQRWTTSDALELPGAESLRPQENVRYALRILTANAQLHADLLYSRPGMFSFNLWSGVPPPTLRNATHWFWLLTPEEQQAIVARLQAEPRTAVISSRPLIDFLDQKVGLTITGPLNDFIRQHYRQLFSVSGYDFLVPRDSRAAPFYVAQNFESASATAGVEPRLITVNVAIRATVARIVLRDVRNPAMNLASWSADNCRVTVSRINALGQTAGEPQPSSWPLQIDGLRQLHLYHSLPVPAGRPAQQLVFLDAAGHPLFEACYDDPAR
ncbi:4-amino-4-deoxy-L-arabinose transferase [Opitutus sp. GAS368]|jgi:hypothetical protein|nr:4-amino-4-deoxy-L-arabinose transferase [Opitutus sp. GAS368]